MPVTLEEILNAMPAERRARIEQRATELIAEELNLRELRRRRKLGMDKSRKKAKKKVGNGVKSKAKSRRAA
jgi:hypothetical protein